MNAAVLFDLDETLFDRTGSLRLFLSDQFEHHFTGIFPDLELAISDFLDLDSRGMTPKDQVYRSLLAKYGIEDAQIASQMLRHYEDNAWRFAFGFDGLEQTLHDIRKSGYGIGIVTNGRTHVQLRSLLALNLDRMSDIYLISEAEGLRKPEPEIFRRAAQKLSVAVTDCTFVGDSPASDMAGAKAVGMQTVWFPNGAIWPENLPSTPDAIIETLAELPLVLRGLADSR